MSKVCMGLLTVAFLGCIVGVALAQGALPADEAALRAALAAKVTAQIEAAEATYPLAGAPLTYYTVPAMSSVKRLPDTFPSDGELCGTLRIIAAKNEFEPASFVVFPFADAANAELKASALTGMAGTIPAGNVDLKIVKCWYQGGTAWYSYFADYTGREMIPELLLNDEKLIRVDTDTKDNYLRVDYPEGTGYRWISNRVAINLPFNADTTPVADAKTLQPFQLVAGQFKQFWVTVKVPADAAPGIYTGSIAVVSGGATVAAIPVSLRVLPFELPKPMTNYDETREFYTMMYNGPSYQDIFKNSGADKAHADRKMLAIYKNMFDHNIRHPRVTDYRANTEDQFIRNLEILRDSGCATNPLFGAIPSIPPYGWMGSVRNTPLAKQDLPGALISRVDAGYEIVRKMFGHSNVYCFGWDEPSKRLVLAERGPWKYIHDKGLKIYSTGHDSHLTYAGYNEDFINGPGEPTRERAEKWHSIGCRITSYAAPHTGPENPDFMRRVHGLQLFKANYDGLGNYKVAAYNWNDFLGEKYNFRRFNMTYPTQNGVVDTLEWEALREGVDDVRYATKLKSLARRAIATETTENIYKGRQALQWLEMTDVKAGDLNTIRVEMVNRILALSEFDDPAPVAKLVERAAQPGDPAVATALLEAGKQAAAAPQDVDYWKSIVAPQRVSMRRLLPARYKIIELLFADGKIDEAVAAAAEASADERLSVGDQFAARLLVETMPVAGKKADLSEEITKAENAFIKGDLTPEMKVTGFNGAAKIYMATRQYDIARAYAALANAQYREEPEKVYVCRYGDKAPRSVEGWSASPILRDPANREARYEEYNRKAAELLIVDVNVERVVGDDKTNADKETAFYMTYDVDGWSMFVHCVDSQAEEVAAGLLRSGRLEMFFAPQANECYYQWFLNPSNGQFSTAEWSPPFRGYRSMENYVKTDYGVVDRGFGASVFIPWEMLYDKLPANGDKWPFNAIRWTRAGGVTWSGKVHDIHNFGVVQWEGFTPERMTAIKRKIVMKGLARYRSTKGSFVSHWSDEVLGDAAFYKQALLPVVEKLDAYGEKVTGEMTAADIETLFDEAVPDWMEFKYKVAELRRDYIERTLTTAAKP